MRLAGNRPLIGGIMTIVVFLAVYVPAVGHGFIKDDVAWILGSRVANVSELWQLFTRDNGFYRPVVSITFALNDWAFGASARGYGLTNVAFALCCFGSIVWLARGLGLASGAAVLCGALWLLNFNGIGGSMLWISGRTYLLVTLAATLSAGALVRGRLALAAVLLLVALFTKEEAIVLPLVLAGWMVWLRKPDERRGRRGLATWLLVSAVALGLYLFERSHTHAMTLGTAPSYYRPTLDVRTLLGNIGHYADWTLTFSVVVGLIGLAVLGVPRSLIDRRTRTILFCSAAWILGGLGLTVFVPSRSVLYVVLPSVGAALATAAILERAWTCATPMRQQRAWIGAIVMTLLLAPVHYLRSVTMTSIADLSAKTMAGLPALTRTLPTGAIIVIGEEPRDVRVNLEAAFGTLLDDAYRLETGRSLQFWIDPPVHDAVAAGLCRTV